MLQCASYLCWISQSVTEKLQRNHTVGTSEKIQLHLLTHFFSSSLEQPYHPLSLLCLYLSFQLSLLLPPLSHCICSYYPPLSPAFSCCLSLSPPPPPLFSPCLALYGKAVNSLSSTVPLSYPSIFLSLVFQWLCKLSNLIADKVINTTLAS